MTVLMEQITKDTVEQLRSNGFLTAFDENLIFGRTLLHGTLDYSLRRFRLAIHDSTFDTFSRRH